MKKSLPIIYLVSLLLLGLVHIWYEPAESYNSIIALGLSWQAMLFVMISWLVILYKDNISHILTTFRAMDIKGVKISMQGEANPNSTNEGDVSPEAMVKMIAERDIQWKNYVDHQEKINTEIKLKAEQNKDHFYRQDLKWRFRYADLYLVQNTKWVLGFFHRNHAINRWALNEYISLHIHDDKEKLAILNALLDIEFLIIQEENFCLTGYGRIYLDYLLNNMGIGGQ